jgi:hypothetical protein
VLTRTRPLPFAAAAALVASACARAFPIIACFGIRCLGRRMYAPAAPAASSLPTRSHPRPRHRGVLGDVQVLAYRQRPDTYRRKRRLRGKARSAAPAL